MKAFVEELFTAPEAGQPMISTDQILVIAGRGIVGDRYGEGVGSFSNSKRQTVRHLSLIAFEAIDEANEELIEQGLEPFEPSETRRNILTGGIDLNDLVGREFAVGEVALRGVELCTPCARPSALIRKPGFREAFADRGGLRAEVLESGVIVVGRRITV